MKLFNIIVLLIYSQNTLFCFYNLKFNLSKKKKKRRIQNERSITIRVHLARNKIEAKKRHLWKINKLCLALLSAAINEEETKPIQST